MGSRAWWGQRGLARRVAASLRNRDINTCSKQWMSRLEERAWPQVRGVAHRGASVPNNA